MTKDYCPGCYDLTTGGVFSPDENKLENAVREIEEETGLKVNDEKSANSNLIDAGWFSYTDPFSKTWGSLYIFHITKQKVDAELRLQKEEVKSVEFWSKQ